VNPRTDFRAAGIFGLKQMKYFGKKYKEVRIYKDLSNFGRKCLK
jgi:hypothetical protein